MIKKLLAGVLALSLSTSALLAADGVVFNVVKGDKEKAYYNMVNNKMEEIGFVLSDPHERINDGYKEKYGETNLDNLGFMSVTADKALRTMLITNPELAGFSPFNIHSYKLTAEDNTYVGHLAPSTMLDIVGVKTPSVRAEFTKMFEPLDKMIDQEIGGKKQIITYDKLPADTMMHFEIELKIQDGDIATAIEDFQDGFEEAFEDKKYIIAGYKDFKEAYEDLDLPFKEYDAFFVYSLCHFKFSDSIFNHKGGIPAAGAFAPCSMYMYVKAGTNILVIGMPKLANWASVMDIKDNKKVDYIHAIDSEIIGIMKNLGAVLK